MKHATAAALTMRLDCDSDACPASARRRRTRSKARGAGTTRNPGRPIEVIIEKVHPSGRVSGQYCMQYANKAITGKRDFEEREGAATKPPMKMDDRQLVPQGAENHRRSHVRQAEWTQRAERRQRSRTRPRRCDRCARHTLHRPVRVRRAGVPPQSRRRTLTDAPIHRSMERESGKDVRKGMGRRLRAKSTTKAGSLQGPLLHCAWREVGAESRYGDVGTGRTGPAARMSPDGRTVDG